MEWEKKIHGLWEEQLTNWPLARKNYTLLQAVRTREVILSGGVKVLLQYNPERMRSSVAKTDAVAIAERPCFLCEKNRPQEQLGVRFEDDYSILVNPYPIFLKHLTIVHQKHLLQQVVSEVRVLFSLAESLPSYTFFYNGARCGASAPDHLHFQAIESGQLPVETDFEDKKYIHSVHTIKGARLYQWENYHRGVVTIEGQDVAVLESLFLRLLHTWQADFSEDEPLLNLLMNRCGSLWCVHLFPRKKHRPLQYSLQDPERIVFSPASIDMGGVLVLVREEDFEHLGEHDIEDMFRQVTWSDEDVYSSLQ